eukprot:COSAG06_NODE_16559_length_994_cov_1.042458_2_plen_87_part_00
MIYIQHNIADIACAHLELHALHARLNHARLRRLKQRAPDLLPRTQRTHTHTRTHTHKTKAKVHTQTHTQTKASKSAHTHTNTPITH